MRVDTMTELAVTCQSSFTKLNQCLHFNGLFVLILILCLFCSSPASGSSITASHAYQQSENIIAELHLLRKFLGINNPSRDPGVQVGKQSIHVYGKALEVMTKIARFQVSMGFDEMLVGAMPLSEVDSGHINALMIVILDEIDYVKSDLEIDERIEPARFVDFKNSSDVYTNIWRASFLLDGLTGKITPGQLFSNTQMIRKEIGQIRDHLKKPMGEVKVSTASGKTRKDINIIAYQNLHYLSRVQDALGMEVMRVPNFPYGKITLSDALDTTNLILAELVRIKIALGINTSLVREAVDSSKKIDDVHGQMKEIQQLIRQLNKA